MLPLSARAALVAVLSFVALACDRRSDTPATATTRPTAEAGAAAAKSPTVASMVPACTDLLLAMGAGDHLVAVSNYDTANPLARDYPRVGDYLNTDWEKLTALRPAILVIQMKEDAVPAGLRERAAGLGATLVNVEIETLADVRRVALELGRATGEEAKALATVDAFDARLAAVRERVKGRTKVRALIALDEGGKGVAGPGGFLDEVLAAAGGENAAATVAKRYATVDRERLVAMNPRVVIQLLPGHPAADVAEANRAWGTLGGVEAVRAGRVHTFTEWYVLTPGTHLADVAERFARVLHPEAFADAATTRAGS